ncbi:rubredoxin-like domain-containing protein [Pontiella sp.]|uniref:rubredoxin-like domain-containing protein n=1 Tax=Pontiella sp. TaxID=2837462 RepID=UPI003567510D
MKKWKCEVCGYIHDGDEVCDACPKCGAPAEKFTELDEKAAGLIERSRHTNALHAQLIDLARQIERVCEDGIRDELDPGCKKVFEQCLNMSYLQMKLAMTEMQGHMSKGKWG